MLKVDPCCETRWVKEEFERRPKNLKTTILYTKHHPSIQHGEIMKLLAILLNPAITALLALLASIVWMLKDPKDKARPVVVVALIINMLYPWLFTLVLGSEEGLLPWKYDHMLFRLDAALGVSAAAIARPLQGLLRVPLGVVYHGIVPVMILWLIVIRGRRARGYFVMAYVAEMIVGPLVYAILPACGPIYAFGKEWLHPPAVQAGVIRLIGIMNAFPSLHVATALVLVLFAPNRFWRGFALAFLAATALSTLSTGEHYFIDLIPGLAFGCFSAAAGSQKYRDAIAYLGIVLCWSLTIRFGYLFLIAHPALLWTLETLTAVVAVHAVAKEWRHPVMSAPEPVLQFQG